MRRRVNKGSCGSASIGFAASVIAMMCILLCCNACLVSAASDMFGKAHIHVGSSGFSGSSDAVSTPPVEVLYVYGCQGSSKPRRDTFDCDLDGRTRLTIRGRSFHDFGNAVVLEQSLAAVARSPPSTGDAATTLQAEATSERLRVECAGAHSSPYLPHHLVFCTLPRLQDIQRHSVEGITPPLTGKQWFDLHVTARNGRAGVLRRAVQLSFGGSGTTSEGTVPSSEANDAADAMRAFRQNDWQALGIGGLNKPMQELFRRAFATRTSQAASIAGAIGVQHVKGIVLHGPPGTGKTLIARTVAKLLGAKNVQVVSGPEIMSKFVGDSEKNLRALFAPADEDYDRNGDAAGLHVIIFDEIDALLRPRGEGDDSAARAVYDGVTTQMLAYMDGIHGRGNLMIIGMTNRLDALDKALLRPGRFEVQIRIPLPDAEGRRQIFAVHTKPLKARRYLSPAIDFNALVADTSSFSGADIAGVVRSAISFALERFNNAPEPLHGEEYDGRSGDCGAQAEGDDAVGPPCAADRGAEAFGAQGGNDAGGQDSKTAFLVTERDLRDGIKEILSAKGSASNVAPFLKNGVVLYNPDTAKILGRQTHFTNLLFASVHLKKMVVVLYGPSGSGTTALSAMAARLSHASFTQMITVNAMAGLTTTEKIRRLGQAFDTASHVASSFIVLDKLEDLLELNMGRRPNDRLTTELMTMIQRDSAATGMGTVAGAKTMVLITTSKKELAEQFGAIAYDATVHVGELQSTSVEQLLCAYGVARTQHEAQRLAGLVPSGISLKRLMFLLQATNAHARTEAAAAADGAAAAEGLSASKGDIASTLFFDTPTTSTFTNLCSLPSPDTAEDRDVHGDPNKGDAATTTSMASAFADVLKQFGYYSPTHKLAQEGKRAFYL